MHIDQLTDFRPSLSRPREVLDEGERCYSAFEPGNHVEAIAISEDGDYFAAVFNGDELEGCLCWYDVAERVRDQLSKLPGADCEEVIELCAIV